MLSFGSTMYLFWFQLLEIAVMKDITGGEFVGDFRNGAIDYGWDTFDDATKLKKRAIELNNGHAAMMGILPLWSTNNWAFLFSPLIKLYAAHHELFWCHVSFIGVEHNATKPVIFRP